MFFAIVVTTVAVIIGLCEFVVLDDVMTYQDLQRRLKVEKEGLDYTSYEWEMGDPCPVCGEDHPNKMMDHAKEHGLATGMIFLQRVLYFNIKNEEFTFRGEM